MATVVNNSGDGNNGAGWVIAVIVLLAVIALGWWALARSGAAPAPSEVTNVNVDVPTPTMDMPDMQTPDVPGVGEGQ